MGISYLDDNGVATNGMLPRKLVVLMVCNGIVAAFVLFGWTMVSYVALPPIEWATWMQVYRGGSIADLVGYPFVVLWAWPLAGSAGAWLAFKSGKVSLANAFAALPVLMFCLVFGFYYLTPPDWH